MGIKKPLSVRSGAGSRGNDALRVPTLWDRTFEVTHLPRVSEVSYGRCASTDERSISEIVRKSKHYSLNECPSCPKSPQLFAPVVLRDQFKPAVKCMSINPTFRGRDKQRIGQVIGTGFDHQGKDAERFADYWIDGNRWIIGMVGLSNSPLNDNYGR